MPDRRKLITGLIFLVALVSGCSTTYSLCSPEIRDRCGSCNPTLERLEVVARHLDKTLLTEIKRCADATLNASVKEVKYLEGTMKACISQNKKIDDKSRDALIKEIDKAKVSDQEYEQWLQCRYDNKPSVVLMDSHIQELVYCPSTRVDHGSNQSDIAPLLYDLGVAVHTVPTNLRWQDDQRVLNLKPELIVIHASAFYERTKALEGNQRLFSFLDGMKSIPGKILVYTRGVKEAKGDVLERWNRFLEKLEEPDLKKKVDLFIMPKGHESCFRDPDISRPFKKKIKEMLGKT